MLRSHLIRSLFCILLFPIVCYADQASLLPTDEQNIIYCGAYDILSNAAEEYQENASFLAGLISPFNCSDVSTHSSLQASSEALPKIYRITEKYCFLPGVCITVRFEVYTYRCGESICGQIIRIWKRCGLLCWEEMYVPEILSYPWELYPEYNGWVCLETLDPNGNEIRVCTHKNGDVCVTENWITTCVDEEDKLITVPRDLRPLHPGYGEPPQGETRNRSLAVKEASF